MWIIPEQLRLHLLAGGEQLVQELSLVAAVIAAVVIEHLGEKLKRGFKPAKSSKPLTNSPLQGDSMDCTGNTADHCSPWRCC